MVGTVAVGISTHCGGHGLRVYFTIFRFRFLFDRAHFSGSKPPNYGGRLKLQAGVEASLVCKKWLEHIAINPLNLSDNHVFQFKNF